MHHIQRFVLDKLSEQETLRYSEIKPAQLDGNVFSYHLKRLIAESYVKQKGNGTYQLTAKGRDFIVRRYEDPTQSAHSIFLLVIKNGPFYLLRTRKVQPLIGRTGFIHGEPSPNTSVVAAAKKRLIDKTGLAIELSIVGSALITQTSGDELQSFSHAIILYGETEQTEIIPDDQTGINFWGDPDETNDILPSCHDIIEMIDHSKTWLERTYDL